MSWADYVIVGTCVASCAFGFWRGFAKEALSLVTWLAAIWLGWRFAFAAEPLLGVWVEAPELRVWAARALVFVLVLVAGGIATWLVRELIRQTGLSGTDRLLGAVFGFGRGVLVVGLAAILLQLSGLDRDPWWQESRLRPYSDRIAAGIRHYAALGSRYLTEPELAATGLLDR
jgi:membrane protein required for colicin V production